MSNDSPLASAEWLALVAAMRFAPFVAPDQVTELRALHVGARGKTYSGWFDGSHLFEMARQALALSPLASAEWLALVAAMRFAPDDDTPRLVGADWLQETNRPELIAWGEFIRYQCEGAREKRTHPFTDSCDCTVCRCERKATALADRYRMQWDHHSWNVIHIDAPSKMWYRGFLTHGIATLAGPSIRRIPRSVPAMFERQPITGMLLSISHLLPRATERYRCGVSVSPTGTSGRLTVRATFYRMREERRATEEVSGVRWARDAKSFLSAISAAIGEAISRRHHLPRMAA